MPRILDRIPWFVSAPVLGIAAVAIAVLQAQYVGPYFERSFLDEPDPLAAAPTGTATPAGGGATPTVVPTGTAVAQPSATPRAALLATGEFRDGEPGHNGSGRAEVIRGADGSLVLRFEEFSVTNGPDLFVVLSTDPEGGKDSADDGLNLGDLKATDGNINYEVPAGTDVSGYRSVIIWCRQFNVVFAVAPLGVQ